MPPPPNPLTSSTHPVLLLLPLTDHCPAGAPVTTRSPGKRSVKVNSSLLLEEDFGESAETVVCARRAAPGKTRLATSPWQRPHPTSAANLP